MMGVREGIVPSFYRHTGARAPARYPCAMQLRQEAWDPSGRHYVVIGQLVSNGSQNALFHRAQAFNIKIA